MIATLQDPRPRRRTHRRAFTLVELMIAMSIAVVAIGISAMFMTNASKMVYDSSKRLELNSKVRIFTDRFAKETIDANAFFVLQNYSGLDGSADLIGADSDSLAINRPVASGLSGDCIVLEYRDDPDSRSSITRVRIYYRDTLVVSEPAPIRQILITVPEDDQTGTLNDILNEHLADLPATHASHAPLVSYQVHGIIPTDESDIQPIFFNHAGRAVSVNFRMQTTGTDTGPARRSASAYNFTISPRR